MLPIRSSFPGLFPVHLQGSNGHHHIRSLKYRLDYP